MTIMCLGLMISPFCSSNLVVVCDFSHKHNISHKGQSTVQVIY